MRLILLFRIQVSGIRDLGLEFWKFCFRLRVPGASASGILTDGAYISSHSAKLIANTFYEGRTANMVRHRR